MSEVARNLRTLVLVTASTLKISNAIIFRVSDFTYGELGSIFKEIAAGNRTSIRCTKITVLIRENLIAVRIEEVEVF